MRFCSFLILFHFILNLHAQTGNQTGFCFNYHKTSTLDNKQIVTGVGSLDGAFSEGFSVGVFKEWGMKHNLGLRAGFLYISSYYMQNFKDVDEVLIFGEGSNSFGGLVDGKLDFYRNEITLPITFFQQKALNSKYSVRYGVGIAFGFPVFANNEYTIQSTPLGTSSIFFSGFGFGNSSDTRKMSNTSFHVSCGLEMNGAGRFSCMIELYARYAGHEFILDFLEDNTRSGLETGLSFFLYFDKK